MQEALIKIKDDWWAIDIRGDVDNGDSFGHCDSSQKRILLARYVRKDGEDVETTPRQQIETLLHELIHARLPDLSEEAVTELAELQTSALFKTRIMEEE